MRILIVEDDIYVAKYIQNGLQAEHFGITWVADGLEAQSIAVENDYNLVILDVGLPGADGFQVLRFIRVNKPFLPVMMLSAHNTVEDRVRGLDSGADDYLVKPFAFIELSARVRALLRRAERAANSILRIQDLEVDLGSRVVTREGKRIDLSAREYALLVYLMQNAGRHVTRAMIMEHVWTLAFDTPTNVVDVYINFLRSKIDKNFSHKLIRTVRGVGYQIERRGKTEAPDEDSSVDSATALPDKNPSLP